MPQIEQIVRPAGLAGWFATRSARSDLEQEADPSKPEPTVRGSVVLTEVGVSQRDVTLCLSELLDTQLSSS
jgi:hypothetical protein